MAALLSVAQALERVLEHAAPLPAVEVPLSEAEPDTVTGPDSVEPDEGEAIEMVGVPFGGLPPLPPAAAPGANTRRKKSANASGRWRNRSLASESRRESMRRSL